MGGGGGGGLTARVPLSGVRGRGGGGGLGRGGGGGLGRSGGGSGGDGLGGGGGDGLGGGLRFGGGGLCRGGGGGFGRGGGGLCPAAAALSPAIPDRTVGTTCGLTTQLTSVPLGVAARESAGSSRACSFSACAGGPCTRLGQTSCSPTCTPVFNPAAFLISKRLVAEAVGSGAVPAADGGRSVGSMSKCRQAMSGFPDS